MNTFCKKSFSLKCTWTKKYLWFGPFLPIPTVVILIPVRGCILIYYGYLFPKMRIIKAEIFFEYPSCTAKKENKSTLTT